MPHKIRISKNLSLKNEAWRAISESLSVSEELCYNRWKKLRDRFAREYRNNQINPAAPITWRYFNDLLFLGRHFRKGVPLIIENIKKRGRPPKNSLPACQAKQRSIERLSPAAGEHIWGADYPYSTDNDELEDELQYEDQHDFEVISEAEQKAHMDYVQMEMPLDEHELLESNTESLEAQQVHVSASSIPVMLEQEEEQEQVEEDEDETEENLTEELTGDSSAVIESVLADDQLVPSAEKLMGTVISNMETVLQQSKDCLQALQQAANAPAQPTTTSLLSKVQMLLDGLGPEQRRQAERKIVHFLCECQIKTLDGQEIEDVAPCHIFS
ncbi:uncharacterized protein Dvir_GJ17728 [Drosophila virilis]|uniref:MADF domain-containing protein n=1 Tax=Drosophila virilis TaxID=7244 RepID=B4LSZ0_DROVI|nr:uncharacterized protein Dvir_GJ17728 [Drosophila virilis]